MLQARRMGNQQMRAEIVKPVATRQRKLEIENRRIPVLAAYDGNAST